MSQKSHFDATSSFGWAPTEPYQHLPLLPPPYELETPRILKACIRARTTLAEVKQAIGLIPDPRVLLTCLPVLEAQASSEIENIVTTADDLFRHMEAGRDAGPATREALRYREALLEGYRALHERPLGAGVAQRICTRIKAIEMSPRKMPGTAVAKAASGEIIYTPPQGEALLRDLLSNWERFMHAPDDLDPLVRMAVAHYQFEAIHPFSDGNGRTGRILNSLFLVECGLLEMPVLYLSRFIIENRSDYYRHLLGVTSDAAWEPWILYMLEAVADTSEWTLAKITAIRELIERTRAFVQDSTPKLYSGELVDLLFERPYCRIAHVVEAGLAQRQAASRYLQVLAQTGVLEQRQHGRDKLYVNTRFLALLGGDPVNVAPFGN